MIKNGQLLMSSFLLCLCHKVAWKSLFFLQSRLEKFIFAPQSRFEK